MAFQCEINICEVSCIIEDNMSKRRVTCLQLVFWSRLVVVKNLYLWPEFFWFHFGLSLSLLFDLWFVFFYCLCAISDVFIVFLFFQFLSSFVILKFYFPEPLFVCVLLLLFPSIISRCIYIFPFQEFMLNMQVWSLL